MNILDDIDIFLPKYLSESSDKELKEQLKKFPTDGTKDTIYTSALAGNNEIFQGDGIAKIPYYDAGSQEIHPVSVMVLSNTCDMSSKNERFESINVCVAPLFNLEKYQKRLLDRGFDEQRIVSHITEIKRQAVTHVVYLPKSAKLPYEAIVRLDRLCSVDRRRISVEHLKQNRLFTLSDYGLYLFLLKLSIHFTRIRERIDRYKGEILSSIH